MASKRPFLFWNKFYISIPHFKGHRIDDLSFWHLHINRWEIVDTTVIHRVGTLRPGDQIVLVVVASAHRGDAFEACEFIMDYLKTRAPFWKKEHATDGTTGGWVDAREADDAATERWTRV